MMMMSEVRVRAWGGGGGTVEGEETCGVSPGGGSVRFPFRISSSVRTVPLGNRLSINRNLLLMDGRKLRVG